MKHKLHTPDELIAGPWTLEEYGFEPGYRFTVTEIGVDIGIKISGSGLRSAENPEGYIITPEGAQAIAALIRAAPEMLKMLKRVSPHLPQELSEDVDDLIDSATRKYEA